MNADTMAEWFRRQDRRVVRAAGSYWVEAAPCIYQAFPYHRLIHLDDSELRDVMRSIRAVGMRYSTSLDSTEGMISYHVVYSGKDYSLEQLPAKARYDVRKGLGRFRVEPITLARLASEGWQLRHETLVRQRRTQAETKQWWEKLYQSADGLPGVECWGATDRETGRLASALCAFICDDRFCILYQQSRSEQLRLGANNVLTYVVTESVLKRPGIGEVFYGLQSLDAPASVDAFKFRMGFTAKPVRQRVVFNPWVAPFFNRAAHSAIRWLLKVKSGQATLAKAEGMVRFAIEGRRPMAEQTWPEALADQRQRLLTSDF